ncbi:hypothetical protein [Vibrio hyugaensis]|uniref:hypothetical protein n=1 Tax=Vibrio hyugaensis TaxID=1534743 RepID=UPI0009E1D6D7|nr:hypothetical protein [Vibrio hyugaensis]
MSEHQGIIEFLAMSGILPLAVVLLCIIGGMVCLILCIFIVSRNRKTQAQVGHGNEFSKENTYHDPRLPKRECYKCKSGITKGKPVCSVCGHWNI